MDGDGRRHRVASQAKMQSLVILREAVHTAGLLAQLTDTTCRQDHLRTHPVAIGLYAPQSQLQPMIGITSIMQQLVRPLL
jgi:hypothetical protein